MVLGEWKHFQSAWSSWTGVWGDEESVHLVMCHMWEETRSDLSMSSVNMSHSTPGLPTLRLHSWSHSTYVTPSIHSYNPQPDTIFSLLCQETSLSSIKDALEHWRVVDICLCIKLCKLCNFLIDICLHLLWSIVFNIVWHQIFSFQTSQ